VSPFDRLIVALDVPDAEAARGVVARLGDAAGFYKVGSQLFSAAGPAVVRELVAAGRSVFLDLKYHDIPNTVAGAVRSAATLGASFVDVHALGGAAMIEAARRELEGSATRLLAITILTSHDQASLDAIGLSGGLPEAVRRLASLAREAGAAGVVASPHEARAIRETCGPDFLIVTPGVHPPGARPGDQARAATPAAAIAAGSDYVVVGRPILEAADPVATARAIVAEIASARRLGPS
jgi:orotidine-5'-phosphate decarboxylase